MDKKIVCHITTVHDTFDTRIFYKECKSLAKYFGTVYLIAPSREDYEINGVQIIKIPIFKNRFIRMSLGNIIAFRRAIKIQAHISFSRPGIFAVGTASQSRYKIKTNIRCALGPFHLSKKIKRSLFKNAAQFFMQM